MQLHVQHFIKMIILGLFVLLFVNLHTSGDILRYVNPKYENVSKIAAGLFILLFLVQFFRIKHKKKHSHHICSVGCSHDHGNEKFGIVKIIGYMIIVFPLVTGFAFDPATLDSTIASNKGSFVSQVSQKKEDSSIPGDSHSLAERENIDIYSEEYMPLTNNNYMSHEEYEDKLNLFKKTDMIEMTEDMFGTFYGAINENPHEYIGRPIKVAGFVYKEEGLASNQFVVSRFMITHCLADASILGFLTEINGADRVEEDTWLELEGILDVVSYGGYDIPMIKATTLNVIDEPSEPYVYPILTLTQ